MPCPLVARAGWLLQRKLAQPEQILLLAFGRQAAEEMNDRIQTRLGESAIQARTFHALALLRAGEPLPIGPGTPIERGDLLRVVGRRSRIGEAGTLVGATVRFSSSTS